MSLFPIFKINIVTEQPNTEHIYVFFGSGSGSSMNIEAVNKLFVSDPENKMFSIVFDSKELQIIKEYRPTVTFLSQSIHIDDSIGVIKLKVFEALQNTVSMDELYMFCLKQETINPVTMYQNLTQNDKLPLTRIRLEQMLFNIYDEEGVSINFSLPKSDKYTFDDILKLDLIERKYLVANVLGQKFVFNSEYPFIANPFLVTEFDPLLEHSRKETSSLNNNLLLETGPIFKNTIYICLAETVFSKTQLSLDYASKIYFPFLFKDSINTVDKLVSSRNKLIESTAQKISERNVENVNMFYDIFSKKKQSSKFSENEAKSGITFIKITMYPDFKIKIPIDVIFKLIHATKEFPLIKFNPETRQENIYRLFADQIAVDGRKIPFLNKAVIMRLTRSIGRNKSVAVYTNIVYKGVMYNMACEFMENGTITVYPLEHFEAPVQKTEDIDTLIDLTVNPLIQQIRPFFEQSGLEIALFRSIQATNVEIRDLTWQTVYGISTPINLAKHMGCISSIFAIESDTKKATQMRFKRVSNFNKRDSQDAFIIEKIEQGLNFEDIVAALMQNYEDVTDEHAAELVGKLRVELELTRGTRRLMIKINPGFKTTLTLNPISSELMVTVNGINDIYYLNTIPVYIDSFIRITQDIKSTDYPTEKITKMCSQQEIEDIEFEEITAQSEKSLNENEVPIFENDSPIYNERTADNTRTLGKEIEVGENMDDLLDILGFADEGSEEEGSLSSLKSLSGGIGSDPLSSASLDSSSSSLDVPVKPLLKPEPKPKDLSSASLDSSSSEPLPKPLQKLNVEEELSSASLDSSSPSIKEEEEPVVKEVIKEVEPEVIVEEYKPLVLELDKNVTGTEEIVEEPMAKEPVKTIEDAEEEIIEIKAKIKGVKGIKAIKGKKPPILLEETENEIDINTVRDVTGMKLKYPNPFSARLEKRAPQLFVREKNEKIDVYTRMCPFSLNDRRQPVILTKEEKEQMVQDHPDDVNEQADFIEYGTDPTDSSKKFYYTCPRFWCILTDKMVTEKDILAGKCGPKVDKVEDAIIPNNAEEVPKNRYVYQFYDDKETKFPGFHKKQTPSGLCIPCCYNKWSTTEMKSRRDICQGKAPEQKIGQKSEQKVGQKSEQKVGQKIGQKEPEKKEPETKVPETQVPIEEELKRVIQEVENYVKGPEKYGPQLGEHRWGFLPIIVQKFLHEVNEECQISKTNTNLKPNHMCLLRHGVETNAQQSFIACIASAIFYGQSDRKTKKPLITKFIPNAKNDVPSIKEMKELIINAINIDTFIKYQNGDLITSFANESLKVDILKPEYVKSQLYKKIRVHHKAAIKEDSIETMRTDETLAREQVAFFVKVVQAFETFILFLRDKTINIDYTYLWDIVCMPNPKLFEAGINLIILEIPEDDITNNIELVCPTNHYSVNTYNARRRSLFLIRREAYFEPIYGYFNNEQDRQLLVTKTFSEYDRQLSKSLRAVFNKIIKPTLGERCRAFLSRPNEYRFKHPLLLDELIPLLIHKKYAVENQILNYQGKVIGVIATDRGGKTGFIPCYPSALTSLKMTKTACSKDLDEGKEGKEDQKNCSYPFSYVTDDIWKSYEDTLGFLKTYYEYDDKDDKDEKGQKKTGDCSDDKSFCRVIKDEQIIGFLTNTNQFVRIYEPVPVSSVHDNIKSVTNNDMLVADMETLTNTNVDSKRVDYIKRIQLETSFFNVFRNTIRILFNDYSNSEKRKAIQTECNQKYVLYKHQLDTVIQLLYELVDNTIIFSTEEQGFNYKNINENEMHNCINKKGTNANKCNESTGICRMTDSKCTLILPKNNLITGSDNEKYYYGRMADELIRYNRIKSFIFKPQAYLSFGQIKYNLRDNEIIILQDLLNADFFKDLIPAIINRYAKNQTYDTAAPIVSANYTNEVALDEVINPHHERNCFQSQPAIISSVLWRKRFPVKYNEVSYTGSNFCAIYLIIDIVEQFLNKRLTVEDVKDDLIDEYLRLTNNYRDIIKVNKVIDILKEEAQVDAGQLQDRTISFEQMIIQEGFSAVNFDLWMLLNKYKIPSVFVSNKEIPETRFNKTEFVCYKREQEQEQSVPIRETISNDGYVFILTPAMYKRNKLENAEYKLIISESGKMIIPLVSLKDATTVTEAVTNYYSIEDYLEHIYEKDNTTKYKPRKKGTRLLEFVEEVEEPLVLDEMNKEPKAPLLVDEPLVPKKTLKELDTKIIKINKVKKIKPTLVLEEDIEPEPVAAPKEETFNIENIVNKIEPIIKENKKEIKETKKTKTKTVRDKPMKVNPLPKQRTKKNKPAIEFEIIED